MSLTDCLACHYHLVPPQAALSAMRTASSSWVPRLQAIAGEGPTAASEALLQLLARAQVKARDSLPSGSSATLDPPDGTQGLPNLASPTTVPDFINSAKHLSDSPSSTNAQIPTNSIKECIPDPPQFSSSSTSPAISALHSAPESNMVSKAGFPMVQDNQSRRASQGNGGQQNEQEGAGEGQEAAQGAAAATARMRSSMAPLLSRLDAFQVRLAVEPSRSQSFCSVLQPSCGKALQEPPLLQSVITRGMGHKAEAKTSFAFLVILLGA